MSLGREGLTSLWKRESGREKRDFSLNLNREERFHPACRCENRSIERVRLFEARENSRLFEYYQFKTVLFARFSRNPLLATSHTASQRCRHLWERIRWKRNYLFIVNVDREKTKNSRKGIRKAKAKVGKTKDWNKEEGEGEYVVTRLVWLRRVKKGKATSWRERDLD